MLELRWSYFYEKALVKITNHLLPYYSYRYVFIAPKKKIFFVKEHFFNSHSQLVRLRLNKIIEKLLSMTITVTVQAYR